MENRNKKRGHRKMSHEFLNKVKRHKMSNLNAEGKGAEGVLKKLTSLYLTRGSLYSKARGI
jgi:hypothetical protein